jgi:hypothetical protein
MAKDVKIRIGGDASQARRELEKLKRSGQDAARGISESFKVLGGVVGGITIGAIAKDLFDTNREFQRLQASLVTATGSTKEAGAAFSRLQTFAAETPYQLNEVVTAFIKLKNLGLDPSQEALRSYGNTASSMGKSLDQMIEAVADAATGEFERLKEFGIKAKKEGDQVSLTFRGVTTTIGNSAAEIEGYLRKLGEVEFAGGMQRQMETLDGAVSNLGDSWDKLLKSIGDAGPAEAARVSIVNLGEGVNGLANAISLAKAAAQGKVGFWDWLTADSDDAKKLLEDIEKIDAGLFKLEKRVKDLQSSKQGNFHWMAADEARLQKALADLQAYREQMAYDNAAAMGPPLPPAKPTTNATTGAGKAPKSSRAKPAKPAEPLFGPVDYPLGSAAGIGTPNDRTKIFDLGSAEMFEQMAVETWAGINQAEKEALAEKLATLRDALRSDTQVIEDEYAARLQTITEANDAGLASTEQSLALEVAAFAEKEKKLTNLKKQGDRERSQSALLTTNIMGNAAAQLFGTLAETQDKESKSGFKRYKEFSKAQAGISTALAVLNALSTVQPWWAAVGAAVVAAGMGAVQVAKINAMEYQGARAAGGPVRRGERYLVGERGPEVVEMDGDGNVIPNDRLGGGYRQSVQVTNVFQISAGVAATTQAEIMRALPFIEQRAVGAVSAALRGGGALSQTVGRMR